MTLCWGHTPLKARFGLAVMRHSWLGINDVDRYSAHDAREVVSSMFRTFILESGAIDPSVRLLSPVCRRSGPLSTLSLDGAAGVRRGMYTLGVPKADRFAEFLANIRVRYLHQICTKVLLRLTPSARSEIIMLVCEVPDLR